MRAPEPRAKIRPRYAEAIVYQRIPTFRIHLPENVAVGRFHRDREFGHQPTETNFLLSFTEAAGTNAVWIESAEGAKDYHPINLQYGEIAVFDGANLEHGNVRNTTGKSRLSVDFRVVPRSLHTDSAAGSVDKKMPLNIGNYYAVMA